MPWRGPLGGDPLETLPGPANPWLMCNKTGDPSAEASSTDILLPNFALSQGGAVGVIWRKISVGMGLMVAGILVIVTAIVGALAVAATLPATAAGTSAGVAVALVGDPDGGRQRDIDRRD